MTEESESVEKEAQAVVDPPRTDEAQMLQMIALNPGLGVVLEDFQRRFGRTL